MLGRAAMVLSFDIEPAAAEEHDEWHTREHLPERLAIPGFLRGSRWAATEGVPRYFVLYEVADLEVLSSAEYLERLNNPSPWTRTMMESYRAMRRGFCRVEASIGRGLGSVAMLAHFAPEQGREQTLRSWLTGEIFADLSKMQGFASAHFLRAAATPAMTAEQGIRGPDLSVNWVLLATGYRAQALSSLSMSAYSLQYALVREELVTSSALRR